MMGRERQGGIAALTALLVLAVGALLAVDLQFDTYLARRRAAAEMYQDMAFHYLTGAESWAKQILDDDLGDGREDSLDDDWARELPPLPIDGGSILGRIDDLQGRFNINNLALTDAEVREAQLAQFRRLLRSLELDERIAQAVADWVDADQEQLFPDGAERDHYFGEDPAYASADMVVTSVSELRAVRGVTPEAYARLLPHVSALPPGSSVNVNTATVPVLASLAEGVSLTDAERLWRDRSDAGFDDLADFRARIAEEVLVDISLSSNNFLVSTEAVLGTLHITMFSHLYRPGGSPTQVIARSVNSL